MRALEELIATASAERIAEAFDTAIQAAYVSTTQHGYAAAMDVLTRPEPNPEPAEPEAEPEPAEPTE